MYNTQYILKHAYASNGCTFYYTYDHVHDERVSMDRPALLNEFTYTPLCRPLSLPPIFTTVNSIVLWSMLIALKNYIPLI